MAKRKHTDLNADNAAVLAELVVDPLTTEDTRVQILNMLSEIGVSENFFAEMYKLDSSFGSCPKCGHENHWLIPEDELAILGWVTPEKDDRVPQNTNAKICPRWQEACPKKKTNY
jgi:hypothetical protein